MNEILLTEKSFHRQLQERILRICNITLCIGFIVFTLITFTQETSAANYIAISGIVITVTSSMFLFFRQYKIATYITIIFISIISYLALLSRTDVYSDLVYLYVNYQAVPLVLAGILTYHRVLPFLTGFLSISFLLYYVLQVQAPSIGLAHVVPITGSLLSLIILTVLSDQIYLMSGNIVKKYEDSVFSETRKQASIEKFISVYLNSKENGQILEEYTIDNDTISALINEILQKILEDMNSLEQLINESSVKTYKNINSGEHIIYIFQHYKESMMHQQSKVDNLTQTSQGIDLIMQRRNTQMAELIELSKQGSSHMSDSVLAVQKIEDNSKDMVDMIALIMEVAERTNILALNAAVEASRAGKAGGGFAIVAKEIKALSSETTQNAEIINKSLQVNLSSISEAVSIIRKVERSFSILNKNISTLSESMDEIISRFQELNSQNFQLSSDSKNSLNLIDNIYDVLEKTLHSYQIDAARIKQVQTITANLSNDMTLLNRQSNLIAESGRKLQERYRLYNSSHKRIDDTINNIQS